MRSLVLANSLLLMAVAASGGSAPPAARSESKPRIEVIREWPLPPALRWAFDARWGAGDTVVVAAGKAGVTEFTASEGPSKLKTIVAGGSGDGKFFFSARLASSDRLQVIGSPFGAFSWRVPSKASGIAGMQAFAVLMDADVHGGRFALLGADRDEAGTWSPDGTIAWTGDFAEGKLTMRSLLRSTADPHAMAMGRCFVLEMGAVRFTPDGALIVVPGVEPGVFLYDSNRRLQRTWRTDTLGFADRCPFDDDSAAPILESPDIRAAWWNDNVVLDELLALGHDPALILRKWDGRKVTWDLVRLFPDRDPVRIPLPVSSTSRFAHLRADLRGDELLILLSSYSPAEQAPPPEPRVIIARYSEKGGR